MASPATVSRCGMVYVPFDKIGWQPSVKSWLQALGGVLSEEDRKVTVQALIRDLNTERVFCDSSAIFVKLTDAQKEKLKNKNQPGVMAKI